MQNFLRHELWFRAVLREKVLDNKFLELVRRFLKAGGWAGHFKTRSQVFGMNITKSLLVAVQGIALAFCSQSEACDPAVHAGWAVAGRHLRFQADDREARR